MKFIISLVLCVFSVSSFAALNNANNPGMECMSLGSLTSDGSGFMAATHKAIEVQSMYLLSTAAIAASNSDYALIQLKKGSTVVAQLDTRAAGQGAVSASVAKAGAVVSAEKSIPAESAISVAYDETDTGSNVALGSAIVCMTYAVK